MRALTVQQPWAWAIVHGGKDVENRTQAWSYRGPLAIHAGARISDRGVESPLIRRAFDDAMREDRPHVFKVSALIGVVDLVDVHISRMPGCDCAPMPAVPPVHAPQCASFGVCCDSPWGETAYVEHGGRVRREVVHLVLRDPRPLDRPIPCKGRLGLWTPPADVLDELRAMDLSATP